jgi:two-component system OmpR family sensor kinase
MLGTGSSRTSRALFIILAITGLINLGLMYVLPGAETIPFHLVWIGLSIVYGLTVWRLAYMALVLSIVAVTTGYVLVHHAQMGTIGWEETTEVPLMTAVFVVMVWHVRRRQQTMAEVARLAETERRRADSQDRFVRLASHELRTPITIARGYTEMVRAAATDPAVREDTRIVLEELDRLAGITQRLVTLMQLDGPYVRQTQSVDALLSRVVLRWRPAAQRQWSVRSIVGEASFNHDRLEAALDCLLENAVKFTAPGDRIEVVGSGSDTVWTIMVTDSGTGMSPERLAAVTADHPGASIVTSSGTGLGMAIVRAVVAPMGGRLEVRSAQGAGTTITLRFPRGVADQGGAAVAPRASHAVMPTTA